MGVLVDVIEFASEFILKPLYLLQSGYYQILIVLFIVIAIVKYCDSAVTPDVTMSIIK